MSDCLAVLNAYNVIGLMIMIMIMIMIMTSSWGLQQRPISPITKKYNTPKIKMDNEAVQKLQTN